MQENIVQAVRDLQREIGFRNAAKGFHDEGLQTIANYGQMGLDAQRVEPILAPDEIVTATRDYRRYAAQRIMLVVTELSEAFEEVRDGRSMTETWYSNKKYPGQRFVLNPGSGAFEEVDTRTRFDRAGMKPEGVPSELADVLIRVLDIGDEFGIDLAAMVQEKLAYNASRPKMHGRQF